MAVNKEAYFSITEKLRKSGVTLVAVSKTKPKEDIMTLYEMGHRDFGENYVQELADKQTKLPGDIRWHFIGHLQSNKVKYIAPFVHLIHGIDSIKLLQEVQKGGAKNNRNISVLLQMHIAAEETKYGMDKEELRMLIASMADYPLPNVRIEGFMGMASFTEDKEQVKKEFQTLKTLFDEYKALKTSTIDFQILSMGMSGDYELAINEGSNMIRIGSLLFGERDYKKA